MRGTMLWRCWSSEPSCTSSTPRGKCTMLWASNGELLTRCGKALSSSLKALCCGLTGYWDSQNSTGWPSSLLQASSDLLLFLFTVAEHFYTSTYFLCGPHGKLCLIPGCHTVFLFCGFVDAFILHLRVTIPSQPQTHWKYPNCVLPRNGVLTCLASLHG